MENSSEEIEFQKYIKKSKKIQKRIRIIIYILNNILEVFTFICISKLVHLSFKSPFKNHIIGDLNNYFYDVTESNVINNNNFEENKINNSNFLEI